MIYNKLDNKIIFTSSLTLKMKFNLAYNNDLGVKKMFRQESLRQLQNEAEWYSR